MRSFLDLVMSVCVCCTALIVMSEIEGTGSPGQLQEESFWLGLIGNETDDSFTWSDDTPMDYSNWATGFPNNQDGRNCVRVRYFDNKWETSNCSERLNYLCQDLVIHKHYVVTMETKVKGILLGLFLMGGLIVLCCLLLQLPCCKPTAADKLAHFTFLQTNSEEKKPII